MPWYENFRIAASALWANRLRSLLTMLGLIIGISSVILIVAIGVGTQKFLKDQFRSFGTNIVIVGEDPGPSNHRPLTISDVEALGTQIAAVGRAAPFIAEDGRVVYKNLNGNGRIYGITPELVTMLSFPLIKGRFFTQEEMDQRAHVVVIGEQLSKQLFSADSPLGKQILVKGQAMTVIGVTKQVALKGYLSYVERGLMMPLTTVQETLISSNTPFGKHVEMVFLETKPGETIEAATFQVTNLMRMRHQITAEDDFFVGNAQEILNVFNSIAAGLTVLLGLIAAISLVVGGINIMNIMLVSVKERTREIGLRKALGASEEVILVQFVIEAVLISVVGGCIGMLLGIGASSAVGAISPLKPEVTPMAIILAVSVAAGVGLFFGIFPARQAARLDPITALRTE
jgi:putative ABC transport system permease protein